MIFYILFAFVIAYCGRNIAIKKGRNYHAWFWICLLFPPAVLLLLTLGQNMEKLEARMQEEKRQFNMQHRKCPFCAEYIKREAKVCKHCGRDVPPLEIVLNEIAADNLKKELEQKEPEQSEAQKNAE